MNHFGGVGLLAAVFLGVFAPHPPAAAQAGAQAPDTSRYRAVTTAAHPRQTTVTVVARIPAGSAQDPQGQGGTAWLLAHLLAQRADSAAGPDATVTTTVTRTTTLFTVVALPEAWTRAWAAAESVLFRQPAGGQDLDVLRQRILDELAFDAGSPVRAFQLEAAGLVAPPSHPWARPMRGTRESLPEVSVASLGTFARDHYDAALATVSVVGPASGVTPGTVVSAGAGATAGEPEPATRGPAWTDGSRFDLVQDITNTWLAVAWPIAPGVSRTSLEFLVHLMAEELDPSPPDPDRFSVDVHLEDTPTGTVLMVEAAVFPEAADRWESKILAVVRTLSAAGMDEDFLGWRRRRFRTARLLTESSPEAEATRAATDLVRDGSVRDLSREIWSLDSNALRAAAGALGQPRILRLGPDLGAQQGSDAPAP